jgi:hypothetical protein
MLVKHMLPPRQSVTFIILQGLSLAIILAINNVNSFSDWNFAPNHWSFSSATLMLPPHLESTTKIAQSANFKAYQLIVKQAKFP